MSIITRGINRALKDWGASKADRDALIKEATDGVVDSLLATAQKWVKVI